jgi:hypothetical protein
MAIIISDTEPRVQYTATSGQVSFTVPFEFFANADLKVYNGTTLLTYAASPSTALEYSVSGAGQTGGGSISLGGSGATLNDVITIYRDLAIERSTDFPTSGAFQIDSLNTELDKIIAMCQQLERDLKFSPRAAATTANTFNITFPNLAANKVLSVNSAGNGLEFAQDITDITTIAGIANDVTTVSGIAANVTTVAGAVSNINTVASNIPNINIVATNIADIITVANDLNEAVSEIETVAADLQEVQPEIDTVANNISDVNLVAGQISPTNNIATLGGLATEIAGVYGNNANITTVAGQISPTNNIATVAGINSQITTVAGLNTEIAGVYAISAAITSVNSNASNINTVSSNLSGSNTIGTVATDLAGSNTIGTVATNIASVQDVSNNIGSVNDFAARYRVSATAPTTSLDVGDLWFDSTNDVMKVYSSGGFINTGSSVNGTSERFTYTVSSTTTTISGNDDSGNSLTYDSPYIDVYLNGVKMVNGTDVTVSSGTSIVFASPIGVSGTDIVDVVTFGTFELANFSIGDANDVSIAGVTDGQVLTWNASSSTFQPGNASSAEVYGFNKNASGQLIVTTTGGGVDNIDAATYAAFDDVLFAASGFTFSISNGQLIATV